MLKTNLIIKKISAPKISLVKYSTTRNGLGAFSNTRNDTIEERTRSKKGYSNLTADHKVFVLSKETRKRL
ncbi:hypothetical protein OA79_10665 [Marinomonas sp. TW1]|nr:hypothetical protein OA79_10665 [Marinomonas sp. TW1]